MMSRLSALTRGTSVSGVATGLALVASCCAHPQIKVYAIEPPVVCPGQRAHVRWQVEGRATLRAERGKDDWDEEEILSQADRTVAPVTTTHYFLTAIDANPADGHRTAMKSVEVPALTSVREVTTTCDPAQRKCSGSFTLESQGGLLHLRQITMPTMTRAGHQSGRRICLSRANTAPVCVATGTSATVSGVADGSWTLETDLLEGETLAPPPTLSVTVSLDCH
jgi:hypothetical protein